jgi:hypothetical protein
MRDLQKDVLELFAEAAHFGRRVAWRRREEEGLHGGSPVTRRLYMHEWRRRVGSDIRAARDARPPYAIVPIGLQRKPCPTCGLDLELREGCTWWMHMGTRITCPRVSRAA